MADSTTTPPTNSAPVTEEQVRGVLRRVVDPEVGANIVALGLVYRIDIAGDDLLVEMTMTSPACPVGDMILDDVRSELDRALPESIRFDIRLVWDPPWNPSMMQESTRRRLGWKPE